MTLCSSIMENLSVILWRKLWRFIGTEEEVLIRRKRYDLLEKVSTFNKHAGRIPTGSEREGFILPGSDSDNVCVLKTISVLTTSSLETYQPDIIMETNITKPGYARLRVENMSNIEVLSDSVINIGNMNYLSSLFTRDFMVELVQEIDPDAYPHGPCATNKVTQTGEWDTLLSMHCPEWPDVAKEWKSRRRVNDWPTLELIEDIIADGCLLVPIGHRLSEYSFLEWRISFSVAERKLIHSFNHTQFLCYGLLKLYLKHVIEKEKEIKDLDLLCSYFLKTYIFYCIEEECIVWDQYNLISCFWTCFNRLLSWIRCGYCPNYFIKENNMFEGKMFGWKQRKLIQHLSNLYQLGHYTFTSIRCLSNLLIIEEKGSSDCTNEDEIIKERELYCDRGLICQFIRISGWNYEYCVEKLTSITFLKTQTRNIIDITLLNFMLFNVRFNLTQLLYHQILNHRNKSNKLQYRLITMLKNYTIHNCTHHDICSGWLQYATLCYLLGQYCTVVNVTEYILTKFHSYIVYSGTDNLLYDSNAYMSAICGRNLTIFQKIKCARAAVYQCDIDFGMYPKEIDSVLRRHSFKGIVSIPPVVYSAVLMFLSYNAIGHVTLRDIARSLLATAAKEDNHFVSELERPLAIALLDRCAQISGDTHYS